MDYDGLDILCYEMEKIKAFSKIIIGLLFVIIGALIATLPYILSYSSGAVNLLSKGGTYVIENAFFAFAGLFVSIIGAVFMIKGAMDYPVRDPRKQYTWVPRPPIQQTTYYYTPSVWESPTIPPQPQMPEKPPVKVKKKRVKTTPDGRPIHKKKKVKTTEKDEEVMDFEV